MAQCPVDFQAVDQRLARILTQYRESPKLLHLIRSYLRQVEVIQQAICNLASYFDLDTAVGDQLTILGKHMGFPRRHCVCSTQPVFGFDCNPDEALTIFGFCAEANWLACSDVGIAYVTINDDELYRKFLRVRRYQIQAYFDRSSLNTAIRTLWGEQAMIMEHGRGRVILAPGRPLTTAEQAVVQLYPRVLPVPLGIAVRFHFGSLRPFGFGEGWGGFCDRPSLTGNAITSEDDQEILSEDGQQIMADGMGADSEWICPVDVRAYDC
ncbi:DUF2612 domain-containing protein [Aureimonas fodinaquatilis]|uniref:DUF2612 domain-containing protein n=1 Tax=Aureimonas fodinaquatilis TaxID=2565783 RepID=A0A5B0DZ32_9HYPH|nr:DUF2612 domain-containing protein [Aureimonas fodinaquatilis]KAA0970800.1 DUF2612 domain-containing protein [Aureimonas fodinaquatilis]